VFADIPGLVEGASLGVGLGHTFLAHCMRCRVLVHLLDGSAAGEMGPDGKTERGAAAIIGAFHAIQTELAAFSPQLAAKPQVIVLNKLDLPAARRAWPDLVAYFDKAQRAEGVPAGAQLHVLSAATGEGVTDMVRTVRQRVAWACVQACAGLTRVCFCVFARV
jgi:GTP-binding protein